MQLWPIYLWPVALPLTIGEWDGEDTTEHQTRIGTSDQMLSPIFTFFGSKLNSTTNPITTCS